MHTKLVPALAAALVCALGLSGLAGCVEKGVVELPDIAGYEKPQDGEAARTHLKAGVILGPYSDMFEQAISPLLSARGYTVELVQYNDYSLPNESLADGQTDLNMFQNYSELISYKAEHDADLSAIAEVPTLTMGIFSARYRSLDEIEERSVVIVPNDSPNFARALTVLEGAGVIMLDPAADRAAARESDIVSNPYKIRFYPMEAHLIPQALTEQEQEQSNVEGAQPVTDGMLAVVNGNFAISGGLSLADALYIEQPEAYRFTVIAVRTEDLHEQFVADILDVLRSNAYRSVIEDPARVFAHFQRPPGFLR